MPARPAMAPFTSLTRPHWVSDGGALDNRPIGVCSSASSTDPARQKKPVRRVLPVRRTIVGPAPDPMHSHHRTNVDEAARSSSTGLLKTVRSPQSIAADLRAIARIRTAYGGAHRCQTAARRAGGNAAERHTVLTVPPLADYRTREAAKQAPDPPPALCCARLSTVSMIGPGNQPSPGWSAELTVRW